MLVGCVGRKWREGKWGAERGQVRLGVGVVLQRWTGGSWVGPVWSGACQGGPDSPMETWEKDKLVR